MDPVIQSGKGPWDETKKEGKWTQEKDECILIVDSSCDIIQETKLGVKET